MFAFVITIHAVACFLLILIVLVQQGRGGGLIDSFSSAESIFGTKTNTFLVKSTSVLAVVFFITCLSLAFLSIQRSKSLIETNYKPASASQPSNGTVQQNQGNATTTQGTKDNAQPQTANQNNATQDAKTNSPVSANTTGQVESVKKT